jgi:hypothetical protein
MKQIKIIFIAVVCLFAVIAQAKEKDMVLIVKNDKKQSVDVLVDGRLFTSYLYSDTIPALKKPVLYPIISAGGAVVTRGYPLAPKQGERVDHPHHIGAWFNYGNVNGLDFWNNSNAIPAGRADSMGTILHEKITKTESGMGKGLLSVQAKWVDSKNKALLNEETEFIFRAAPGKRIIDRTTRLTAVNGNVSLKDNKEGVIGMRVARELELPSQKPVELSDSHGNITKVPALDNTGVTGNYLNSQGVTGADVWGKRGRWTALSGIINGKDVTVVIFDRPGNPGFPTYWHARDYGLFAANPLGQGVFSNGAETLNFSIEAGKTAVFTYRIMIYDGKADKKMIEKEYQSFIHKKK